jgi:hypothetical protein
LRFYNLNSTHRFKKISLLMIWKRVAMSQHRYRRPGMMNSGLSSDGFRSGSSGMSFLNSIFLDMIVTDAQKKVIFDKSDRYSLVLHLLTNL